MNDTQISDLQRLARLTYLHLLDHSKWGAVNPPNEESRLGRNEQKELGRLAATYGQSVSVTATPPPSALSTAEGDEATRLAERLASNICGYLMHPIHGPTWEQAKVEAMDILQRQVRHLAPSFQGGGTEPTASWLDAETETPGGIKAVRERYGMTQAAFGEYIGVRQATVSDWENGRVEISRLGRLAITALIWRKRAEGEADANRGYATPTPPSVREAVERAKGDKVLGSGFYRDAKPGTFGRSEWLDLLMACQDGRATCMRVLEIIEREAVPVASPDGDTITAIANAFLRWPLPESVCADLCTTKQQAGRVGTNLLSFTEAQQMVREVVLPLCTALANVQGDGSAEDPSESQWYPVTDMLPIHGERVLFAWVRGKDEDSVTIRTGYHLEGKGFRGSGNVTFKTNPTHYRTLPKVFGKAMATTGSDTARIELLAEIKECAESIVRNMREDIAPELRDDTWVTTAACHAVVILQDLAAMAQPQEPRK